ncbi:YjbF family lipoprotein [Halomonas salinarum]|uniref:YjbF family lipoprotein n=1 Tax=Halomonas salinarum TaxID=1158993 RepID=UPI001438CC73
MTVSVIEKGRPWAASLCVLLASCSSGGGTTPTGDTLSAFFGPSAADISAYAQQVPYASLALSIDGNKTLAIMAYQGNADGSTTLWQAKDRATLALKDGIPYSTAGFDNNLMGLSYDRALLDSQRLDAYWQDRDGQLRHARASLTTQCAPASSVSLPLTTLPLQRCTQEWNWHDAGTSINTLWRSAESGRIWAGDIQPWPGAPDISWQVARPWWSD